MPEALVSAKIPWSMVCQKDVSFPQINSYIQCNPKMLAFFNGNEFSNSCEKFKDQ